MLGPAALVLPGSAPPGLVVLLVSEEVVVLSLAAAPLLCFFVFLLRDAMAQDDFESLRFASGRKALCTRAAAVGLG